MGTNRKTRTTRKRRAHRRQSEIDLAGILAVPSAYVNEKVCALIQGRSVKSIQRDRQMAIGARYRKVNGKTVRYRVGDVVAFMESQPAGGGARQGRKVA